jgi:hypothetical protein
MHRHISILNSLDFRLLKRPKAFTITITTNHRLITHVIEIKQQLIAPHVRQLRLNYRLN